MNKDYSYGIIPLRQTNGRREYLAIRHIEGHWDFPKGHLEKGETEKEAAARELTEETGFNVTKWLDLPTQSIYYQAEKDGQAVNKKVIFFVAEVAGKINLSDKRTQDARWFNYQDLLKTLTYQNSKEILEATEEALSD